MNVPINVNGVYTYGLVDGSREWLVSVLVAVWLLFALFRAGILVVGQVTVY
jgi:hypothetical protein